MFRFDHLIRSDMTMRDIKRRFPQAAAVFETFGFREICDDCAVEIIARRSGLSSVEVVDALTARLSSASPETERSATIRTYS